MKTLKISNLKKIIPIVEKLAGLVAGESAGAENLSKQQGKS